MKLLNIVKNEDGSKCFYFLGILVFKYKGDQRKIEFDKLYERRFDGFTKSELEKCIKEQFRLWHGYYPNLNKPKTFNEKLTWEKLYYRNPLMTICADKVKGRDYFLKNIDGGEQYLVKQLGVYDSVEEINFDLLPKTFVLKSNWGSGLQIIVKDKSLIDVDEIKQKMSGWLKKNANHYFCCFEWGYKNIEPKIVCEEFLDFEYKLEFFCFNGEPRFYWIVLDDKTKDTKANFYDLNGKQIPVSHKYPNFDRKIEQPVFFKEMYEMAKVLCGDFPHVRCDFYKTKNSFKFCEMTFFHWGASKKITPKKYDRIFGDMMKLPETCEMENDHE